MYTTIETEKEAAHLSKEDEMNLDWAVLLAFIVGQWKEKTRAPALGF